MMRQFNISFIVIFLVCATTYGQVDSVRFTEITGVNGKPIGKIRNISQDRLGFMWFSGEGERCIYRYDGNKIVAFKNDQTNPNSLGGIVINAIYADVTGLIWVGMGEGLDQYNPVTGIFTHYRHSASDKGSLSRGNVNAILRDHLGRLWVGTDHGLERLDEKTGEFIHYRSDPANPKTIADDFIWNLYEDRQGVLWIATGYPFFKPDPAIGGLNRLNADGSFTRFKYDPNDPHSLINNNVRAMFEDSRGLFWVGTSGDGLHTMDRKTGKFERHTNNPARPDQLSRPPLKREDPFAFENDQVTFITEDRAGTIWIGSMWSGMNRYDPTTRKITRFDASNGFPDRSAWNGYVSTDGSLWVTTQSNRLFRGGPINKPLNNFKLPAQVFSLHETGNRSIWAGTDKGGLYQLDENLNIVNRFLGDPSTKTDLLVTKINALLQDRDDTLWLGTNKGLIRFNTTTKRFYPVSLSFNVTDVLGGIFDIKKDSRGLIWFTSGNGLANYDPSTGLIKHYAPEAADTFSIRVPRTISLLEDRRRNLWVGVSTAGIARLDRSTDKFHFYLADHNCICLFEDHQGELWAGTSKGLFRYVAENDQFLPFFDTQSDLISSYIYGISETADSTVWAYTPGSIIKINKARTQFSVFGSSFGVHQLSPNAIFSTRKGQLLIGHDNGFFVLDNKNPQPSRHSQLVITDLFVNNEIFRGTNFPFGGDLRPEPASLRFQYDQNTLGFNFALMDYNEPMHVRYFTMLEGYDNTWREALGEKSSYYFNVTPGRFTYRIKAFNSEGEKFETKVVVVITPPWWDTWWFQSLVALTIIAAVYYYIQYRSRALKKNNLLLEQKVKERTNELNNSLSELKLTQDQLIQSEKMASLGELTSGIAHEIKNPLNFISNFSELNSELIADLEEHLATPESTDPAQLQNFLKTLRKNSEKIMHHGKRIDGIVKGMLQHSRQANRSKELTNINLLCEEALKLAYHGFKAKEKSFSSAFEARLDPNLPGAMVIPQDISRVLLNLINNSFYTVHEKKKGLQSSEEESNTEAHYKPLVTVSTGLKENRIVIEITDNGQGISPQIINKIFQPFFTTKPTGEGTGLGLSMSYDIITKGHNGDIRAVSSEGQGTSFILYLPLNN